MSLVIGRVAAAKKGGGYGPISCHEQGSCQNIRRHVHVLFFGTGCTAPVLPVICHPGPLALQPRLGYLVAYLRLRFVWWHQRLTDADIFDEFRIASPSQTLFWPLWSSFSNSS